MVQWLCLSRSAGDVSLMMPSTLNNYVFFFFSFLIRADLARKRLDDVISCFEDGVIFNILSDCFSLKQLGSSRTCYTCLK